MMASGGPAGTDVRTAAWREGGRERVWLVLVKRSTVSVGVDINAPRTTKPQRQIYTHYCQRTA